MPVIARSPFYIWRNESLGIQLFFFASRFASLFSDSGCVARLQIEGRGPAGLVADGDFWH